MNEQFRKKEVKPITCSRKFTPKVKGTLENYLHKNVKQNKSYVSKRKEGKLFNFRIQNTEKIK